MQAGFASAVGAVGASRQGDVLVVTMTGSVNLTVYDGAIECAAREVEERTVRALVIDATKTSWSMSEREGELAIQRAEHFSVIHEVPCGIVVQAEMLETMRRHCVRVSAFGVTWLEFTRLDDALLWAASWSEALPGFCEHARPRLLH